MSYTIVSMPISSSKYGKKCPYSMRPQYITVHNTANDASARNEVSYMRRNSSSTSYHVAVDDKEVVIAAPFSRNCFHAGDGRYGTGNRKTIGIEICYSRSGGSRFDAAEDNAARYIASLLKAYGWGINRVKRHYDWSRKYCPHRTMDRGWTRFLNMVRSYMGLPAASIPSGGEGTASVGKVAIDKKWGPATTRASQKVLGTYIDGIVSKQSKRAKKYLPNVSTASWKFVNNPGKGSNMVRALQRLVGASVDGRCGPGTVAALQRFLKSKGYYSGAIDSKMGPGTVGGWQRYINSRL
nr:MAG TPA: N-acetylmuramoyl-L-alanine amidase [Caudoviricetes sp.]